MGSRFQGVKCGKPQHLVLMHFTRAQHLFAADERNVLLVETLKPVARKTFYETLGRL